MSFDVYGVSTIAAASEFNFYNQRRYENIIELACRCYECSCTSVFILKADKTAKHELPEVRFKENENPTILGYREDSAFPEMQPIPTPNNVPEPAANFFKQAAGALAHGSYDAAGAMFRKCLESVSRNEKLTDMVPEEKREEFENSWLKKRITILKEVHAIPPALGDLVDVIKEEGDEAVHEDMLYSREDAEALQQFAETFLEQTFTIPAQIERIREKKNPPATE